MNHELIRNIVLGLVLIISVVEYLMMYMKSGSLCAKQKFRELKEKLFDYYRKLADMPLPSWACLFVGLGKGRKIA